MVNVQASASKNANAEMLRVLVPVIVILILVFAGSKLLKGVFGAITDPFKAAAEGIGIKDTEAEVRAQNQLAQNLAAIGKAENEQNPWSPLYYKQFKKCYRPTYAVADADQKKIWNAIGTMYDSPEEIQGVIKSYNYKSSISFLAEMFEKAHQRSLLDFLSNKLDTTAQKVILNDIVAYVNKLPSGKIKN